MSGRHVTYHTVVESPLGPLLLTSSDGEALGGLYLESHKGGPVRDETWRRDDEAFRPAAEQLAEFFAGDRTEFNLSLSFSGTGFQRNVWEALRAIPFGETISYAELARRVGTPRAVRAVGAAVGRNPISIIVPCHRIVGSNGSLTGYAGGLERKRWLLEHEQSSAGSARSCPESRVHDGSEQAWLLEQGEVRSSATTSRETKSDLPQASRLGTQPARAVPQNRT